MTKKITGNGFAFCYWNLKSFRDGCVVYIGVNLADLNKTSSFNESNRL